MEQIIALLKIFGPAVYCRAFFLSTSLFIPFCSSTENRLKSRKINMLSLKTLCTVRKTSGMLPVKIEPLPIFGENSSKIFRVKFPAACCGAVHWKIFMFPAYASARSPRKSPLPFLLCGIHRKAHLSVPHAHFFSDCRGQYNCPAFSPLQFFSCFPGF